MACVGSVPWPTGTGSSEPFGGAFAALRFQASEELISNFLSLRDLLFQFANIGMSIRVMRTQVGQLRSELLQFLIDSRQIRRQAPSELFDDPCSVRYWSDSVCR